MTSGNNHLSSGSGAPPVPLTGAAAVPPPSQSAIDTTLSDSWLIVRKRKWIILSAALLGAIIGVMSALSTPKVYEATGTIQVHPGSSEQYRVDATGPSALNGDDIGVRLETEVSILTSQGMMLDVADRLNLQDDKDFWGSKRSVGHNSLANPATKLRVLEIFKRSLSVKRVPKTEIIAISYSSVSPTLSSNIVNTLINFSI